MDLRQKVGSKRTSANENLTQATLKINLRYIEFQWKWPFSAYFSLPIVSLSKKVIFFLLPWQKITLFAVTSLLTQYSNLWDHFLVFGIFPEHRAWLKDNFNGQHEICCFCTSLMFFYPFSGFMTLSSLTTFHFVAAMCDGPGYVPKNWKPEAKKDEDKLQFCESCQGFKAPRSHHCRKCKLTCVQGEKFAFFKAFREKTF